MPILNDDKLFRSKQYILSIGMHNYLENKSGISRVIIAQQQLFNRNNISYIYIMHIGHDICGKAIRLSVYKVFIDGKYLGIYGQTHLKMLLRNISLRGRGIINIHLHRLPSSSIANVQGIIDYLPNVPIKAYLHDFYMCCDNYILLKNNKKYCGGKGYSKELCVGCKSYIAASKRRKEINDFLRIHENRITFISPSYVCKRIFTNFFPMYEQNTVVIPHLKFKGEYRSEPKIKTSGEIRIGFVGHPNHQKGWNAWESIVVDKYSKTYKLYVFNNDNLKLSDSVKQVMVSFDGKNLNAMGKALRDQEIDIVLLWSISPETYSYTFFEAYSAKCYIITNRDSGNIADCVNTYKNGVVLNDELELDRLLLNKELLFETINKYRNSESIVPEDFEDNDALLPLVIKDIEISEPTVPDKVHISLVDTLLCMIYKIKHQDKGSKEGKL